MTITPMNRTWCDCVVTILSKGCDIAFSGNPLGRGRKNLRGRRFIGRRGNLGPAANEGERWGQFAAGLYEAVDLMKKD
jgi:hypothetical protein